MRREVRFSQKSEDRRIDDLPVPHELFFPVSGYTEHKNLKPGVKISVNTEIVPGILSPVNGSIKEFLKMPVDGEMEDVIRISDIVSDDQKTDEGGGLPVKADTENVAFPDLSMIEAGNDIVLSAVDTDPLNLIQQQLLRENIKNLGKYFEIFRNIFPDNSIHFAVSEDLFDHVWELETAGISVHKIDLSYPAGLPEILIGTIAEKHKLNSPFYLNFEEFLGICGMKETGLPIWTKVVTVSDINGSRNIRVMKGAPLKCILTDLDLTKAGKVIVGGPMRGYAVYDMNTPVTGMIDSVYVQYEKDIVRAKNHQCINCGKCNEACPVSLSVNLITRYSEFSLFEKCSELKVENCIECGLCAYHCPAGRSLLQLIRLAKNELKDSEGDIQK